MVFGEVEDLTDFIMWKVMSFTVKEREFNDYPIFHSGDSYIIMNFIKQQKQPTTTHIHVWIGKDATMDKTGTAAMMALQLASHIGGHPILHTECQGEESILMKSYFISEFKEIRYKSSPSKSNFRKTSPGRVASSTSLLQICNVVGQGDHSPVIKRVELASKTIKQATGGRSNVSYVLENNMAIYIKHGPQASIQTRRIAKEVAKEYQSYYATGNTPIIEVTSSEQDKEFFKFIEDHRNKSAGADPSFDEEDSMVNLYKTVVRANGKMDLESVTEEYPLSRSMLDTREVIILDCTTDIFVWHTSSTSWRKRAVGKECANMFYNEYERPTWARITHCLAGHEHPLFKLQFANWRAQNSSAPSPVPSSTLQYDYQAMIAMCAGQDSANKSPTYSSSGKFQQQQSMLNQTDLLNVFAFKTWPSMTYTRLKPSEHGQFSEEDCYLVVVTTLIGGSGSGVKKNQATKGSVSLYWWQGTHSSRNGYSHFVHGMYPQVLDMVKKAGYPVPTLNHIHQRKEPSAFLQHFGNIIVLNKGSVFNKTSKSSVLDKYYQVLEYEYPEDIAYIQEVDHATIQINSHGVYCKVSQLNHEVSFFQGYYNFSSESGFSVYAMTLEPDYKMTVTKQQRNNSTGENKETFFGTLPRSTNDMFNVSYNRNKLLRLHIEGAKFKLDKVPRYHCTDLTDGTCALLESRSKLFLWIGANVSESLSGLATRFAKDYLRIEHKSSRSMELEIVRQHNESLHFKLQFAAWDRKDEMEDPREMTEYANKVQSTIQYRSEKQHELALVDMIASAASSASSCITDDADMMSPLPTSNEDGSWRAPTDMPIAV
ncbi:hypothetical protein SAMD00019534_031690 [Acytostelium subglobosum LB1]|uniref:hypothetical protein n=1 Tax=Acytostelium subglobosum LB1 TaxID=1410327 RepID=UPI000644B220|nr:hypothetical protein SAMD00019534_031690 [Acytostelium subglobosum LB1]GAM19994.1 hypothetical protein SAMD00019534_031690 [Acytostelium subglobosum LB1]|eukprot:XP_012756756.1 hypothetical protein SAMD00019534_031690 [Acytostelium subglobosum LB1]